MPGCLSGDKLERLLAPARSEGREILLEPEGYRLARAMGLLVPRHLVVAGPGRLASAELDRLGGDRVVVKVVSPEILHKTEAGGVRIVSASLAQVEDLLAAMATTFAEADVRGFLICEHVPHGGGLDEQLLLGARWTDDFGPVLIAGAGGLHAEYLASNLREGRELAVLCPALADRATIAGALGRCAPTRLATSKWRGLPPRCEPSELARIATRALRFAARALEAGLREFEVNPLVFTARGPVALDVLARLETGTRCPPAPPRQPAAITRLLQPRSIAVVGVSERLNPGHIIVRNTLAAGFPPRRLWIVKPGVAEFLGCSCVPDLESLPAAVDLLVLAVSAAQLPTLVERAVRSGVADAVIAIPGGVGEHADSRELAARVVAPLHEARARGRAGPVLNGANCLGIRSRPGAYDTLFIPRDKLPVLATPEAPVALISQSGAFAVARASKLAHLSPLYIITAGNQLDLTIGDYLEHLAEDEAVRVFACAVEGFRPLDGLRFLAAARRIQASGRRVLLYRSARTRAGAIASASHSASVAGDYLVTRELARQAGVLVADSLADFEDLVMLCAGLADRPPRGRRLGAMSNAGFECVAIADGLRGFCLADLGPSTRHGLGGLLAACSLEGIVEVRQPLDLTPMMTDRSFAAAARLLLDDPGVDLGLVGCVPLTAALATLPAGTNGEDLERDEAVASLLLRIREEIPKPWVVVVDSGARYEPFAAKLLHGGIPVFRTADRALRLLDRYVEAGVRQKGEAPGRVGPGASAGTVSEGAN